MVSPSRAERFSGPFGSAGRSEPGNPLRLYLVLDKLRNAENPASDLAPLRRPEGRAAPGRESPPPFHRGISGDPGRPSPNGMPGTFAGIALSRRRRNVIIEVRQCAPFDSFSEDMLDVPHKGPVLGRHKGKGVPRLAARPVRPIRCV